MKKIIKVTVIIMVIISLIGCSIDEFTGSGISASEFRSVDDFEKVSSEGTFKVFITEGDRQSLKIVADNNILHRVKTEVRNGKLKLYLKNGNYRNVHLEAHIKVRNLKEIENSGVGDVHIHNVTNNGKFKAINSGSANIYLDGHCTLLDIHNEGSGNIFAYNMPADKCEIYNEGSGDVEVTCISNLTVRMDGSGNVYYKGRPSIDSQTSGSGRVISKN